MIRKTYCLICLLVTTLTVSAQDIKNLFIQMPDTLLPYLTKVNRADCIDFLASNMKAEVKNRFDRTTEMTSLSKDYIALTLSPQSKYELKLLPTSDTTNIICSVYTYEGKVPNSHVKFYTTDWKELSTEDYLSLPQPESFLPDSISVSMKEKLNGRWEEVQKEADILFTRASLSDSTTSIRFTYTTPLYLDSEKREILTPLLKQKEIVYPWTNGKYSENSVHFFE